ncbi:hypothetical protein VNO78_06331 [Psophocarpus tetragonolobus]|uniref:Uncharacterized protein n=1 Tax=Psophocarpus tetragonolobus TaxID=3891 RepID=A0AAN9SRY0_PSOTE
MEKPEDLGEARNLESLNLKGCMRLEQIHPSIGRLRKLSEVYLGSCCSLTYLPHFGEAISLEILDLSRCDELRFIDPSIGLLTNLIELSLKNSEIPDAIGNLCSLERLDLSGNSFATLPSLTKLSKLYHLDLQQCKHMKYLPQLPSSIGFKPSNGLFRSYDVGLFVFNCPKLVEREVSTTIGFPWRQQLTQAFHEEKSITIGSVIPGSTLPEVFNNQYDWTGNYVSKSIDTSPVMHDERWIGAELCVIFTVPCYIRIPVGFYGNRQLVSDGSDHMWLSFQPRDRILDGLNLKCYIVLGEGPGVHVEVKTYGYRWVYKDDPTCKRKHLAIEQSEGSTLEKRGKDAAYSSQENTINWLQN